MQCQAKLRQFVLLAIWGISFLCLVPPCYGGSNAPEASLFGENYHVPLSFSPWQNTEDLKAEQTLILGQNRYKKYLKNYGLWGNIYGYGGRLRPKNSVFDKVKLSDFGMQVGVDVPGGAMFSKCYYYSFASPDYTLRNAQLPLLDRSELDISNHLFGVRWTHYDGGLFMLFGLNGGFDDYKLRPNNGPIFDAGGWQMGGNGEIGLDVELEKWNLRPYIGLDYRWLHHNDLNGSNGSLFDGQTYNALYSNFGMRAYYNVSPLLSWQTRFAWLHNYLKKEPIQVQRFGSVAGLSTSTQLFFDGHPGSDWFWFGTGLKLSLGDSLRFFVDYDLAFNKYTTNHTGSLMAILSW